VISYQLVVALAIRYGQPPLAGYLLPPTFWPVRIVTGDRNVHDFARGGPTSGGMPVAGA
jgi:hypothetical protein